MVYVFDMDGVLTNSAILGGIEAVNALCDSKPGNRILSVAAAESAYPGFEKTIDRYRPFLVYGPEFIPICTHFRETSPIVENREQFEAEIAKYKNKIGNTEYESLWNAFSDVRSSLPSEHPNEVIGLLIVYKNLRDIVNAAKGLGPVYVSSSNQMARKRLEMLGLGFDQENIFTKATHGKTKEEHLNEIARREGVSLTEIIMVEDNLSEIYKLHHLGVNLVMAPWGYNTKNQQEEASRLGAIVLNQESLLERIRSC